MSYISVCLKGLEKVTEKETKGKQILPGRVEFKLLPKKSNKLKEFKSINKFYKLLKKFEFNTKEDILEQFKILKIKINKKFKIDCDRKGEHDFKSVDVEKLIGVYLQKKSYELDFKNPETIIFVDIIDKHCLIGLLLRDDLQKRNYRVKLNPDTLNPCIAYSALQLVDYKKGDIILDPYCRDGIVTIEAAIMKKGKVYGFDKNIRNARINSKIAKTNINFSQNEIDWLDTKFKKNSVKIVTYLPSLSKRHSENEIRKIYSELTHQFDYIIKDKLALILRKTDLIKEYLGNFKLEKELNVQLGSDSFTILVLKKTI